MPLTPAEGVCALKHVVRVVLNQSTDSPMSLMLAHVGFETIHDLLGLDNADIDGLGYVDEHGIKRTLSLGHREMLRAFVAFVIYREQTSAPVGDNWLGITQGEFDEFRAGAAYLIMRSSRAPMLDNSTSNAHVARSGIVSSKKGIKHGASLLPTFKEDKQWDHSKRNTVVHAHDQDVAEVLEEGYSPVNQEDKLVFNKASVELSLSSSVEVSSSITDTVPVISESVSPVSDVTSGDDTVVVMHQDSANYPTNDEVTTIGDVMHRHNDNPKDDCNDSSDKLYYDTDSKSLVNELVINSVQACNLVSTMSLRASIMHPLWDMLTHWPTFINSARPRSTSHPPTHLSIMLVSAYPFIQVNLHDLRMGSEGDVDDLNMEGDCDVDYTPMDTRDPDDPQYDVMCDHNHLEHAKHLYGYLSKLRDAVIRVRTEEPDYSGLPDQDFDWAYSVYGDVKEIIPHDAPEPLGRYVMPTHYVDTNLFHDMIASHSVTEILHLLNKMPTVETATARTCVEQVIDLHMDSSITRHDSQSKCLNSDRVSHFYGSQSEFLAGLSLACSSIVQSHWRRQLLGGSLHCQQVTTPLETCTGPKLMEQMAVLNGEHTFLDGSYDVESNSAARGSDKAGNFMSADNMHTLYPVSLHKSPSHGSLDMIEEGEERPRPVIPMLYEQRMGSEGDVNIHPLGSSMSVAQQEHLDDRSKSSILSRQTPNDPPVSSLHEQRLGSEGDVDNAPNDGETPDTTLLACGTNCDKEADGLLHADVRQVLPDTHQVPFSSMTCYGIQKAGQGIQKACKGIKFTPRSTLHDLRIGSEGDVNLKDDIELNDKKYRLVTP